MSEWTCSCGRKNVKNYCQSCGLPRSDFRPDSDLDSELSSEVAYEPPPAPDLSRIKSQWRTITEEDPSLFQEFVENFSALVKDPKGYISERKSFFIKLGAFSLLWLTLSGAFTRDWRSSPRPNPVPSVSQTKPKPSTVPAASKVVDMHNVPSDLSMGGICLGDSVERVHSILGKEDVVRDNQDGYLRYHYADLEVVVKDNVVEALVSKTPKAETKRGLHQGSTLQEVVANYGRDYERSENNGDTLIEYPFTSLHRKKSLLRFAMQNDRVNYISARTLSDEIQTVNKNESVALQTFRQYWENLNNRAFSSAYNLMTDEQKNFMGELADYRKGYDTMIENQLTQVNILEENENSARITYTVQAKDRVDGKIQTQIFQGIAVMIKFGDSWKIDRLEAKLVKKSSE